nr:MAG: major capsid protein [Microvirus sp.]
MKSNLFTLVKQPNVYKNTFDLTHDRKFSCNMGELVPILALEAIPGDNFTCNSNHLMRLAPMLSPMMHKVDVYMHFWKVPIRILWSGYDEFYNSDGENYPEYPYFDLEKMGVKPSSISDYLGFPLVEQNPNDNTKVSALYHAAYYKVWYEFYRDQNLQDAYPQLDIQDGDNFTHLNNLKLDGYPFKRAWEKDYFTSCLPFPQKGSAVYLPLGGLADVVWEPNLNTFGDTLRDPDNGNAINTLGNIKNVIYNSNPNELLKVDMAGGNNPQASVDNSAHLKANLATALQITINDLRLAEKIQEFLELRARGGTRYSEYLQAVWNVRSSDARLQRPEYLGGSKTPINISEVLQTSETSHESPLADMAGHGISVSNMNGFTTYCEEHCIILGLMSVMPKPSYFQGLDRKFTRLHPFDHYQPPFAQLGEQSVLNQEIYFKPNSTQHNTSTFGYQARWAEYRDLQSSIHGDFKTTNLHWHMANDYGEPPVLNELFIQCNATERIFTVQSLPNERLDHLWVHVIHNLKVNRALPMFNVPSLV